MKFLSPRILLNMIIPKNKTQKWTPPILTGILSEKKNPQKLLNRKMGEIVQDFLRGVNFARSPTWFFHIFRGLAVLTIPGIVEWSHRGWGGLDLWWTFKLNGDFLCLNDSGSLILSMLM